MERSELDFDMPEDFFDSPSKLFLFCGNVKITDLIEKDNIASFDFHSLIFAETYLLVDDKYLFAILNSSYVNNYKENDTHLLCLFSLLTLAIDISCTLQWFQSKFPTYDEDQINGIKHMTYVGFRRRMLKFQCHKRALPKTFLHTFFG